jgi:dipeptidyl aminopeptidase/acylaminoacyl peptidase
MIEVKFESGGEILNGLVYVAAGPGPHPTTVFLHGYPGHERNLDLAQAVRRAGSNAIYFPYRGAWGNGGTFSAGNAVDDAAAVLATVRDPAWAAETRSDPTRIAVVGHSFGGLVGTITVARDPEIRCYAHLAGANFGVTGLAARADPGVRAAVAAALGGNLEAAGGVLSTDVDALTDEIVDGAETWMTPAYAPELAARPLLVVAGTRDEATPPEQNHAPFIAALEQAGAGRVTELVLDDDHSFSASRIQLARRLVDWQAAECW